jgi:nucleotide-binding universal stress UspA family protein
VKTVLTAIDARPAADEILASALVVAPLFDAVVELVHISNAHDRSALAAARGSGIDIQLLEGDVPSTLVRLAAEPDVVAIALGASERRPGAPLGHEAVELLTRSDKPLVVVPRRATVPPSVRRVLIPLDRTRTTAAAVELLGAILRERDVEAVLLHVHEAAPMFSDQVHHEIEAWSTEFTRRYCPPGLRRSDLHVRVGVPADEVVLAIERTEADLVVLGWQRRLSPGRAKVVRAILEHGIRPVLLFPHPAHGDSQARSPDESGEFGPRTS